MNRRRLLISLSAVALAGPASSVAAQRAVGSATVTSVSDGSLVLPGAFFFEGLPSEEVAAILAAHDLTPDQLLPPCNLTLLQDGERAVLFDAGSGAGFMPSAGELVDSLDALGVAPEDVTHIVFTHGHPDHLWGVLDDFDDPVFTEAEHIFGRAEWDYWRDPETVNVIGEARAAFAVGAARRLEAVEDAVRLIDDGEEVLPGVMAVATPGHTPGHMSFEVRSGSDAVLIGGDAIGNHHIAFARPDWASGSDQDPDMGAATRMRLMDRLVADRVDLMGFHLPNGGLGRVERKDGAYRFVPADA
ncbi:MAG: MBL fold metallo-hydrolase [Pseudomonadota bacterium]